MSKKRTLFGYGISFIVAGVLLYLVFKNISFEEFMAKAEQADYRWVYLSIGITFIAYLARAYRWSLLINPLGYETTTIRTSFAVMIAYLANLVLPRLGEVTRCGALKKSDGVPMSLSLGTVISERIIDVISLAIITLITLVIEFDELSAFLAGFVSMLDTARLTSMLIFGCVALIFAGIGGYWLYHRLEERFRVILRQLLEGLLSLRKIRNFKGFIISTITLWVTYYFMGFVIFFAIAETSTLGWEVGLMLLVSGGIALTIPVQGGFGTYHTITSGMLLLYSIEKTTGVFVVTLAHSTQVVATVLYGIVGIIGSLLISSKSSKKV